MQRRYPNRTRNRILAALLGLLLVAAGTTFYLKKRDDLYTARYHDGIALWEKGDYVDAAESLRAIYAR